LPEKAFRNLFLVIFEFTRTFNWRTKWFCYGMFQHCTTRRIATKKLRKPPPANSMRKQWLGRKREETQIVSHKTKICRFRYSVLKFRILIFSSTCSRIVDPICKQLRDCTRSLLEDLVVDTCIPLPSSLGEKRKLKKWLKLQLSHSANF
jgi:hypothetical protein